MKYYYIEGNNEQSFTLAQLKKQRIYSNTSVWTDEFGDAWKKAEDVAELKDIIIKTPPPVKKTPTRPPPLIKNEVGIKEVNVKAEIQQTIETKSPKIVKEKSITSKKSNNKIIVIIVIITVLVVAIITGIILTHNAKEAKQLAIEHEIQAKLELEKKELQEALNNERRIAEEKRLEELQKQQEAQDKINDQKNNPQKYIKIRNLTSSYESRLFKSNKYYISFKIINKSTEFSYKNIKLKIDYLNDKEIVTGSDIKEYSDILSINGEANITYEVKHSAKYKVFCISAEVAKDKRN